jgi:hypothetical protein
MVIVFNVRRGLCAFIRTALNQGILYDCGRSDDFDPLNFIKAELLPHMDPYIHDKAPARLAQTILSHPHTDHIANVARLWANGAHCPDFTTGLHTCPHDKIEGSERPEALNWSRINNQKGGEELEEAYRQIYAKRTLPLQTIAYKSEKSVCDLDYGLYYVRPPVVAQIHDKDDQEYTNGLSIILYLRHARHIVLIPGDINPQCMKHILQEGRGLEKRFTRFTAGTAHAHPDWHCKTSSQPSLRNLLQERRHCILLAPHHGLESGFCQELYDAMWRKKPGLVVVSDSRRVSESQGRTSTVYASSEGSVGQEVMIEGKPEFRNSVSTKNGHHILLVLGENDAAVPRVYLEKNPRHIIGRMCENA